MNEEIVPLLPKFVTQGGAWTAAGSGLWAWMGNNYQQIGAVGVLVGIAVGIIGLVMQFFSNRRRDRMQKEFQDKFTAMNSARTQRDNSGVQ